LSLSQDLSCMKPSIAEETELVCMVRSLEIQAIEVISGKFFMIELQSAISSWGPISFFAKPSASCIDCS